MDALSCLRCGFTGDERTVGLAVVDLEAEARLEGASVRSVPVALSGRGVVIDARVLPDHVEDVPERYGSEYRCRDRIRCEQRWEAQRVPHNDVLAEAQELGAEEIVPWL